ncbi:hypothetical protein [Pseudorhodoplanes sp.]|jgi:hypothetical protein|uniref:hypothetical protein n=1 Tax=Pseudorhodoplanes sp. TaxID=1934341 RepID=UPI002C1F597B|nr:hypothetical protein [Pseudorhodoplanes sp.]HWV42398.1 hypothetical protein [Pseudorhodoplanes sp.]
MASKDPFNFLNSPMVPPIPCVSCGNNMHCVHRSPVAEGERQQFKCATCSHEVERVVGSLPSDAAIQAEAEKLLGMKRPKH